VVFNKGQKLKTSTFFKIAYLILLVTTFFYVKAVLVEDSFKASEEREEKAAVKERIVSAKLNVELGEIVREYQAKLKNTDSVKDFLDELRENQGFKYESDLYTYGTEVVSVFEETAAAGKRWAVVIDNKDITKTLPDVYLTDDAVYIVRQVEM
jgi:hypothetical protein